MLPKGLQTTPRSYDPLRLAPFLQHRGPQHLGVLPTAAAVGRLPLPPAPRAPFAPTTSAEVVLCSPGPRECLNPFLSGPPRTPLPHPPAPQGPSASAPLPPAGHRAATTEPGLGQQEVRPKGQQTVGSRPRPRASRLRIQLCFHGNAQSRGSTVRSCVALAAAAALCTAKSSCRPRPPPGPASGDPLRALQSPAD